jgi:hypothetical protein
MDRLDAIVKRIGGILPAGRGAGAVTLSVALLLTGCASTPEVTDPAAGDPRFDALEPVEGAGVAMAYIDPEADFGVFRRVAILEPHVAFRSNWQRDQNRSRSRSISSNDMERIKADVASLFKEVFADRLQADGGYEIVEEAGYDVLLLRPAIVDLDITAPDVGTAARSRTYTVAAGAATLYIELFDSVSGAILGRAADRQSARQSGARLAWSNGVTNAGLARRVFGRWADRLRDFLDSHYSE